MKQLTWADVKTKLDKLKSIDKQQAYGIYHLNPVLDQKEIKKHEDILGVSLPDDLSSFYTTLGNGVAGPWCGIYPINKIVVDVYNADKPYLGEARLKEIAREKTTFWEEPDDYQLDDEDFQGLIPIIDLGCGHEIRLISSGENIGTVVYVSVEGTVTEAPDKTLFTIYDDWLDTGLNVFKAIEKLIDSDLSMAQIYEKIKDDLNRFDGRDLAVSFMGIKKPKSLFGSEGLKRFHGASQFSWYEEQLRKYRSKNTSSAKRWWKFW